MDPFLLREYEVRLEDWLAQGYQLLADDVDGELRITVNYVAPATGIGTEREQEYWPMVPEIVELLGTHDIQISRALAGPRSWAGAHPEEWD
jgi:hypothetical protein